MARVVKTDGGFLPLTDEDRALIVEIGAQLDEADCGTEEALIENCADADALLVLREPITAHVLDHLPSCKVVTRFGVGLDTVDVPAATERGIRVTNVPDANSGEVASHALAMILSLVRRLPHFDRAARRGDWNVPEIGRGMRRLDQLTVGVVGLGRTGSRLATAAGSLGFRVVGFDPFFTPADIRERGAEPLPLEELVASADVVSVHVPLIPETTHLIDRDAISRMKPGAIVVNVARGGIVDEDALLEALTEGRLSGAGLDSYEREPLPLDSPLLGAENLILSPHAGHYSQDSFRETIHKAVADVARVLQGSEPQYPVNSVAGKPD
jgi:D-3-phosphoglycerate dehydrogenase / 2-oxoglutarate reductase